MTEHTRNWRVLSGGLAMTVAGVLGVVGLSGTAAAEPESPEPGAPPATVAQMAPAAAPNAAVPGSSVAALAEPALVPATSGTLTDFFREKNVTLERQVPQGFTALSIVMPIPQGWAQVPDPNVPDAFFVIADKGGGDLYTANGQLVVYKLVGDFDPKEAITHGFIDSQMQSAWQSTDASLNDFGGFPSALIEGTYRSNGLTLNASRRHVIASSGTDRYLVTLTVTTTVGQSVAASGATEAVINGFKVSDPAAQPPAAAAQPADPATPVDAVPSAGAPVIPVSVPTT